MFVWFCFVLLFIVVNGEGKLFFIFVEFIEDGNFRGMGKSYFEGMGVMDEFVSVYID